MRTSPFSGNQPIFRDIQPEPPPAFHAEPELMWASIPEDYNARENDTDTAPAYPLIKKRSEHYASGQLGLEAFWKQICQSRRLWILDTHFCSKNIIFLRDKIEQAPALTDFHLITAEKGVRSSFVNMEKILKEKHRLTPDTTFGITEIDRHKFPYLHDRFAVTDDELWHFGGTVGCLQAAMTAVSRGWDAKKRQFIDLFEKLRAMHRLNGA